MASRQVGSKSFAFGRGQTEISKNPRSIIRTVLSDRKRRRMYDAAGLMYGLDIEEEDDDDDDDDDEVEGFSDFLQEMVSLINDARKEKKTYTPKELQSMFWDMAHGFGIPEYDTQNTQKPMCEPQWLHGKTNDTVTAKKRMRSALKI